MREAIRYGLLLGVAALAAACTSLLGDFEVGGVNATGSGGSGGAPASSSGSGGAAPTSSGAQGGEGGAGTTSSSSTAQGGSGGGDRCEAGFADCDDDPADCETDLGSNQDCGACNAECITGSCNGGECTGITQLAVGPARANWLVLYNGELYWSAGESGTGAISKVPTAGGRSITLSSPEAGPYGIFVNSRGVYWAVRDNTAIRTVGHDGGMATTLAVSIDGTPLGVAGNETEIFWSKRDGNADAPGPSSSIGRIDLITEGIEQAFVSASSAAPHGLAVDQNTIYWADRGPNGAVNAASRATGQPVGVVTSMQTEPYWVALDDAYVYWTDQGARVTRRAKSGGELDSIGTNHSTPTGIAVDETHVYWTDQGASCVRRWSKMTRVQQNLASSQPAPRGIVVDDSYVYWVTESEPNGFVRKVRK